MGFGRSSHILLNVITTIVIVVQCQSKAHDNARPAASGLTKHKAKELATNPGALIHEALNLVRRRRSIDVGYDDRMTGINPAQMANLARRTQTLAEKTTGEERKHTIDKRQIPDSLGMNEFIHTEAGPPRPQELLTGFSSEEKAEKRVRKYLHENVSDTRTEIMGSSTYGLHLHIH